MIEAKPSDIHGDKPAAASTQGMVDHKELAAFAFQRTRMPIVVADARQPDYPIVLANDAFLHLTGYSADELVGRNCRLLQGEDTSREAVAEIRAIIAAEREGTVEILNYRKDGSAFWNQLHLSPIRDDDGRLAYYFASQIDVTEYRKVQTLEEAEHRLLLEVDHRTKNVLAIVDSIVRLTRSDNAATYAASVQQRVQALARTHMLLAENGWQQASLHDIISLQVSIYGDKHVEISGPSVMVPAPSVQPLGLAVHELAANAAVHGALSHPDGSLTITWRHAEDNGLTIEWREQGIREKDDAPRKGFGTVLVGAVLEKQLGGTISREWGDQGLRVAVKLPSLNRVGASLRSKP
ncbi:PAS domain S-box-containing protein [Rhizobium sp. BK650]|uniref:blue-light-activated histidine kinase n=1 Tax=Rhizobium sp. BK650 TaxID=2586990 RepID=UPI00160910F2|nr:PAS domain-containing protein [Rhizobium sp. BK650]MBB3660196.1 PAS domain S-box-containing protein [Rhizobium sp. BK650]